MIAYLDNAATTETDPEVLDVVLHYMKTEYGNAGSRTHQFGLRAKNAVQKARAQIAASVNAEQDEVVFTSGATEANNLALLGLEAYGRETGKTHIVSTAIEHKAVLEPLAELENRGFIIDLVKPDLSGAVSPNDVLEKVTPSTLAVSVMQVNNETGVQQPISQIAEGLKDSDAFFHVDAAQGFGKRNEALEDPRIDLISISGHKIHAPMGVGGLITRKRSYRRLPLRPLTFGGGQERGLRPGTLPVPLIAGFGKAAEIAERDRDTRREHIEKLRTAALAGLSPLEPIVNGNQESTLPNIISISIPDIDAEAFILATKNQIAVSNGSACTSTTYSDSHVLTAMGASADSIARTVRLSWTHLGSAVDWKPIVKALDRVGKS